MDSSQMAELRQWARRLEQSSTPELRAAARAILLLSDEVDRLRRELAEQRREPPAEPPEPGPPEEVLEPAERPDLWGTVKSTWRRWRRAGAEEVDEDPRERRRREVRRRRRRGLARLVFALALLGGLVFAGLALAARMTAPELRATGPPGGAEIGPSGLRRLVFSIRSRGVARARWELDGVDVTSRALVAGDTAVLSGRGLGDGDHTLRVTVGGGFLGSKTTRGWRFTIDTTPPRIGVPAVVSVEKGRPFRIAGTLEPGARLTVDGRRVAVRDGRFAVGFRRRPRVPVALTARDRLGNQTTKLVTLAVAPRRPPRPIRAVHVTFFGWSTTSLREPVLKMIDEGRIDAVELDLKDESGAIGFDAPIPLARRIGAARKIYDLEDTVRLLHSKGVRVIGRLVAFRDPVHAAAAWRAGQRDQVVQSADGGRYAGYGGFTNFANPVVRRYNIEVALAAAKAGVDEILYDYVRRPDGPLSSMVFPGLEGTPEQAIVGFLAESRKALEPYPNVFLGASVFGVATTRPREVGQDIPRIAEQVDYVAPMLYPSHWARGEYGLPHPNAQPYDIVFRSLRDFQADVQGTGARIVPWLQDFSLGVTYGAIEVRAQIQAARDAGIEEFMLWDPEVTYTADALEPGKTPRP